MSDELGLGPDAVDRFFARQRRDILARLELEGGATDGARWLVGLAAAAILVLGVGVGLLQPPRATAESGWITDVGGAGASLPLQAFGVWEEPRGEEAAVAPLQGSWVLADGLADAALPSFLAPYGAWTAEDEEDT